MTMWLAKLNFENETFELNEHNCHNALGKKFIPGTAYSTN